MMVPRYYTSYQAYPLQMVTGLTKIGGLIAIFQFGTILYFFHKKRFERQLLEQIRKSKKEFNENKNRKIRYHRQLREKSQGRDTALILESDEIELAEAKRLYSLENFDRLLMQVKTMEKEIQELKMQIKTNNA